MKKLLRFLFKASLWFIALSLLWVLAYRFVPVPFTYLMLSEKYTTKGEHSIQHNWVGIEEISDQIQLAVICAEDQNFLKHNGFDMEAIKKAYNSNKTGKKLRGGSTISQQTAKNVFLWPKRNWLRKGLETWFTFLIETFWSKQRILEVYLNSIEMGQGIYGIEAASQFWFNKKAKDLTKEEATAFAAILPNPSVYKATPASKYIRKRKSWILKQMHNYGTFTLDEKQNDLGAN